MTPPELSQPCPPGPASVSQVTVDQKLLLGWAHDCNSASTLVLGYLSQLEEAGPYLPRQYDLIQGLRQAVEYAVGLPRQLVVLARGVSAAICVYDLRPVVQGLEGALRGRMPPSTNLVIRLCAGPARVEGDPQQLKRALINLATNAFEAMPYGGELVLEVEAVPPGAGGGGDGTVRVHVRDTGPGIAPEVLARLYEPLVSTRSDRGGTGLGLYVVAQLIGQHNGRIDCDSRRGQGTHFTITLPAAGGDQASLAGPHGQPLVLVIEGDPHVRQFAGAILSLANCGHRDYATVEEARDGAVAVAGLARAVVLDHGALRDDNARALQELLALTPDAGVVVTSNDRSAPDRLDASRLRACLVKPYTSVELIDAIRAALGQR